MKEDGSQGFSKDYWLQNYSEPESMDGLANAKEHASYIKSFFAVELIDLSSVIDFGFGLGYLFSAVVEEFMPFKAYGIEPSDHAYKEFKRRYVSSAESMKLTLKKWDLVTWAKKQGDSAKYFDLGLCTSVFQYLTEEEIDFVLPILSKQVKYLYFSVPTDTELKRQVDELDFFDEYAIRRSKAFYLKKLKPYFVIIGCRLLESRHHFSKDESPFTDYLFRSD